MIDSVCKRAVALSATAARETVSTNAAQSQSPAEGLLELIHMLREGDIVELFFSQKLIHSQLVQRSENLLKLLITTSAISEEQL